LHKTDVSGRDSSTLSPHEVYTGVIILIRMLNQHDVWIGVAEFNTAYLHPINFTAVISYIEVPDMLRYYLKIRKKSLLKVKEKCMNKLQLKTNDGSRYQDRNDAHVYTTQSWYIACNITKP